MVFMIGSSSDGVSVRVEICGSCGYSLCAFRIYNGERGTGVYCLVRTFELPLVRDEPHSDSGDLVALKHGGVLIP